mgnify:CR=1 FL=1
MQDALETLNGDIDDAPRQELKAARGEFNRASKDLVPYPDFLEKFRAFMAQFPKQEETRLATHVP